MYHYVTKLSPTAIVTAVTATVVVASAIGTAAGYYCGWFDGRGKLVETLKADLTQTLKDNPIPGN